MKTRINLKNEIILFSVIFFLFIALFAFLVLNGENSKLSASYTPPITTTATTELNKEMTSSTTPTFDIAKIEKIADTVPLNDLQVAACYAADNGGTCETKLKDMGLVLLEDCCKHLKKCC